MAELKVTGDLKQWENEVKKLQKENDKLQKKLDKVNLELKDMGKQTRHLIKMNKELREADKRANKAAKEMRGMKSAGAGAFTGAALSVATLTAAVWKGVTALDQYREQLNSIAESSKASSEGVRSFFSILPTTQAGQKFGFQALLKGAEGGLKPGESASLIEPIVSALNSGDLNIIDDEEQKKIQDAFGAAIKGAFIGIPAELAGVTEVAGANRGLAPGEATGLTLEAASLSQFSKEDFAKMIPATALFGTLQDALSTAVAISGTEQDPGEIKTLIRNAGKIFGAQGRGSDFLKKRGLEQFAGKDVDAIISGLYREAVQKGDKSLSVKDRVADYTAATYGNELDSRVARAISATVNNRASFQQAQAALAEGSPVDYLQTQYQGLLNIPGQATALSTDRTAALTQLNNIIGEQGVVARADAERKQAEGLAIQSGGGTVGFDPETGKINRFLDGLLSVLEFLSSSSDVGIMNKRGMDAKPVNEEIVDMKNTIAERLDRLYGAVTEPAAPARNAGEE